MVEKESEVKSQFTLDAEGVQPSELDRITKRIQEYKIGLSPNSLQIANAMLQSQLQNGLFKLSELEAVVLIRNEIAEGMTEYQTQLTNAQKRIQQLSEEDIANRQATVSARDEAAKLRLLDERQLRKDAEERVTVLEAILSSHGIQEYLDLSEESFDTKETLEEIAEGEVEQEATEPEVKKPSKAFELARALNPAPIAEAPQSEETLPFVFPDQYVKPTVIQTPSEQLQDELEPIVHDGKEAVDELDQQLLRLEDEGGPVADWAVDEEPASVSEETVESKIEKFYEEVEKVEADVKKQVSELDPNLGMASPVGPTSITAKPKVSAGQLPPDLDIQHDESDEIEAEKAVLSSVPPLTDGDSVTAPLADKITLGKVKMIPEGTGVQEEVDEIEIPNRPELEKLTKAKIRDEADKLGFDVNTNQTKALMIDSFEEQTKQFITDLQDSGEFVSATETGDDDDVDRRDGGYF